MTKTVFVFGSNEAGIHGAGAAKFAYQHKGALYGFSYGHCGNSFAIPTKNVDIQTIPLKRVRRYVEGFLAYAEGHPKMPFQVTAIGCGLAGFGHHQIAPLFEEAPPNCMFDTIWMPILGKDYQYWGTF